MPAQGSSHKVIENFKPPGRAEKPVSSVAPALGDDQ
jgi:hypothetical protein